MKNSYALPITQQTVAVLSPTHQTRWDTLIKNHEIIGMQKEILHLERKAQERELSSWELERLEEVRNCLAEVAH